MRRHHLIVALPPLLLVFAAYVWFVSVGTWTRWPAASTYYNQLANSFARGQSSLQLKPNSALLALPNPYDPDLRAGVTFLSDASLFRERYYLYFGPVPALLILPAKALLRIVVPDQHLVFAFACGTVALIALLLLAVWKRFLKDLSPWIVGIGVLGMGLSAPFAWVLGSRASVHNVAISAGQCFFLAGLYAAFQALDGEAIARPKAVLAGVLWAGALGSRITQIIPIAFVVVLILVYTLRRERRLANPAFWRRGMLAFLLPLVFGLLALGWYNWVRFGSVLETGITYQLALLNLQKYRQDVFSVQYALQNLYNYLLMLPKLRYNFPYVWPRMGIRSPISPLWGFPSLYFAEDITGLIYTSPFLVHALIVAVAARRRRGHEPEGHAVPALSRWLLAALGVSFLSSFALFLVFFWASERYLLDFIPPALTLAMIGFWHGLESLKDRPLLRAGLLYLGLGLLLVSALVSSLLAIAQNADGFRELDPILWQQLNNLFRP